MPKYAKVIPLYRSLGHRETADERLMKVRFPPYGDPLVWVHRGPDAQSEAREWHGRSLADHRHTADEPGGDCRTCGFPWWPDSVSEVWTGE